MAHPEPPRLRQRQSELIDYAPPRTADPEMSRGVRAALAALGIIAGLVLCSMGRDQNRDDLVLLGIGCVIAGATGYFAGKPLPRQRVPFILGLQVTIGVVACVVGTFLLLLSSPGGTYELRRGRWDPEWVRAWLVFGGGVAWFVLARLVIWHVRRRGARVGTTGAGAEQSALPHRQRVFRRRIWAVGVGLFFLIAGLAAFDVASGKYRLWREHRACATYTAPADQVVFTEDPDEAALLLGNGAAGYEEGWVFGPTFSYSDASRAQHYAPPLQDLFGGWWASGSAFVHAQTARGGEERIVIVSLSLRKQNQEDAQRSALFKSFTVLPQGWPNPQHEWPETGVGRIELPLAASDRLRVFAGQPDPLHRSHFTIQFEVNGQPGQIDGWLENGGIVRMTRGIVAPATQLTGGPREP